MTKRQAKQIAQMWASNLIWNAKEDIILNDKRLTAKECSLICDALENIAIKLGKKYPAKISIESILDYVFNTDRDDPTSFCKEKYLNNATTHS